jgi:hypothetical protein
MRWAVAWLKQKNWKTKDGGGRPKERKEPRSRKEGGCQTGMDLLLLSGLSADVVVTRAGTIPILSNVANLFDLLFGDGWMDGYRGRLRKVDRPRHSPTLHQRYPYSLLHCSTATSPTSGQKMRPVQCLSGNFRLSHCQVINTAQLSSHRWLVFVIYISNSCGDINFDKRHGDLSPRTMCARLETLLCICKGKESCSFPFQFQSDDLAQGWVPSRSQGSNGGLANPSSPHRSDFDAEACVHRFADESHHLKMPIRADVHTNGRRSTEFIRTTTTWLIENFASGKLNLFSENLLRTIISSHNPQRPPKQS